MSPNNCSDKQGFPPMVGADATLLILGSMPGDVSLQKQQYYAHPRNAFWAIMAALFDIPADASYSQQKSVLLANGVAVWDVLQCCRRTGSLDASIEMATVSTNNFSYFFSAHPNIKTVCFNGGMAEKLYKKYILPTVEAQMTELAYLRLPSTSPAYAAMTVGQKIQAWQVIRAIMVK